MALFFNKTNLRTRLPIGFAKKRCVIWVFILLKMIHLLNSQNRITHISGEQPRLLFTSPHIMMDGTFDSCPPHFNQIYSIHALKDNQSKLLSSYLNMIVA